MRVIQKEIKKILDEVADELGLPYYLVEDVYFHQWRFLAKQVSKGVRADGYDTYENILLKRLGTFVANRKYIEKLNEVLPKKNNEKDTDGV